MTSNERKIINFLWGTKEKTNVRLVAQKTNLSSDYARLLCRSLSRSGHIKFENDFCHLLKKGRGRFENSDPVIEEPKEEISADKEEEIRAEIEAKTEEKTEIAPVETELKPKSKEVVLEAEVKTAVDESEAVEEKKTSLQEAGEAETKPADNPAPEQARYGAGPAPVAPSSEIKDISSKEEPAKQSGWSIKRIVNWFAEKK